MDEYVRDNSNLTKRAKTSNVDNNPSTSFNAAKVEESSKNYVVNN
ncbi:hypothetical protein [Candidatus Mesenet endosymbiont of Phosphuga atrata]